MKQRQVAAGAAFVAAAAAVLLWAGRNEPAVAERVVLAPRAPAIPASPAPAVPPPAAAGAVALPTPPAPRLSLAAAYGQARDVRQFVLEALQRPGEGGLFYARIAASRCAGADQSMMDAHFRRAIESTGTVSTGQMRVADAAVRRCASFQGREAGRLFERAVLQSRDGSDPFVNAEREAREAREKKDLPRLRAAIGRVLEIGDPFLIAMSHLPAASRLDTQASQVDGLRFGDRVIRGDEEVELDLASTAMELGACRDGTPCDYDTVMEHQCLTWGICQAGRWAHLRAVLIEAQMAPEDIERLPALIARVRKAIADKDLAFFVR